MASITYNQAAGTDLNLEKGFMAITDEKIKLQSDITSGDLVVIDDQAVSLSSKCYRSINQVIDLPRLQYAVMEGLKFGRKIAPFGFAVYVVAMFVLVVIPRLAAAHGSLGLTGEIAARQEYSINNTMNLAHCVPKLQQRGILDQAVARRIAKYNEHAQLIRRTVDNVLKTDHEITDGSITMDSTDAEVFATRDDGCVLSIETTEGPFYVEGEFVRWALWDDEFGIPMYLDLQIIDTETCEPAPDVWVEVWHANATGVYSGVVTNANGAGDSDPDNAFKTFHRGLQKTNADGAVWFGTNFPGHYAGRTPHVHIMTHAAGTEALANDTVQNNVATHAGQMFFDQKLVEKMRKHERYGKNKQHFIENKDDAYFRQEAEFTDPVMSYVLLDQEDKDIAEGIMAWKLVGVNMTNVRELYVADTFLGQ
ncbi:hypothetical protein CGCVW01_v014260 [Colletotrichum viniferum]|nr:hypothetical protein CGCVW01_v014260 [Colletotrichum viniferum]